MRIIRTILVLALGTLAVAACSGYGSMSQPTDNSASPTVPHTGGY